ncbi:MAG: nicotinamide mononucleotide transporter [Bacteroidia bacterium]|nr:nicotinamide mononucleotide transporter [Bacteroidia bacterium]
MTFFRWLEITGFLFGIAGVWLTIRKSIWCFPAGIVNVLITAYLVFDKKLFADTLQQLVYFVLLVTGWIFWLTKKKEQQEIKIETTHKKEYLVMIPVFLAGSFLMGWILNNYSTASLPYADSLATVLCFIAQWMIAKRKIENWILWMASNPAYIVIYLIKEMPLYAVLSGVYFLMAVAGYLEWKKMLKEQHENRD